MHRVRTWALRGLVIVAALAGLGYVSSLVSASRCEAAAAQQVADELGQRDVFVLADIYPGSSASLNRAGFTVRECRQSGNQFDCFPWAGVTHARVVGPFVVDVKWGFVAAPLSGRGTRTRYITLFGVVFAFREGPGWVT